MQTDFNCGIREYGPLTAYLIDTITYADGETAYHFQYEATPNNSNAVTGRISEVQLPQGGYIHYSYTGTNDGVVCSDGSTLGLTRKLDADSGSAASTWTFTRTSVVAQTSHTEVVDAASNYMEYDFVLPTNQPGGVTAEYYETYRKIYQGAASGTPVIAQYTCYNGTASPCTTNNFNVPFSQIDTYETLDGLVTTGATTTFNANSMETANTTYFYGGAPSRGAALETDTYSYGSSITGLVTEHDIYSGTQTGSLAGKTTYAYDGGTLVHSSGVPNHIATTCPCGNLTQLVEYANASTSYSESATYEDTGSPLSVTTPNGTSTLSYDPSFVYNKGVTLPTPSSGVQISSSESFDTANTGLPLSTTDPNSKSTTVPMYDEMLRPTEMDFPDGGKTTWGYTPTTVTANAYQTASSISETQSELDGYGRPSRATQANGQSGNPWYQRDTCYGGNGQVSFASYAYQGTGLGGSKVCSGNGDSFNYDVLGRVTSVQHADGTSVTYSYKGRAMMTTDENGVSRIVQRDPIGRITNVCEISQNSLMPGSGSPVSCGTDISGTGFLTVYTNDLANHETTVTQGAQTRVFQADWLGRPILVQEPESGQTTYSYVYNSTGLQVTRIRPKANQAGSSVKTTTVSQYDALGRVVSVTYTDGTPSKTYSYDASQWNETLQNPKGRLTLQWSAAANAGTVYSYDPMGRVILTGQCTPNICGYTQYNTQYSYDWLGNITSVKGADSVTTAYTYTVANEVESIASSLNDATHPPNLVSSVLNGPFGPISWQLGNGLSAYRTYDALGRVSGGWLCKGTPSQNCSGGTQYYGFTATWRGNQFTGGCDTVLDRCINYSYDEFGRTTGRTVTQGQADNYTYVYDRWGNRAQQNGGQNSNLIFNTTANQIMTTGYGYDAAGNLWTAPAPDGGSLTLAYDADGKLTHVAEGGNTIMQYTYDALNHLVEGAGAGSDGQAYVDNLAGMRHTTWDTATGTEMQGQSYWGRLPVEYYDSGSAHYQHQDWEQTVRMRTTYSGGVEGTFSSLPFGDGFSVLSGTDTDGHHFAGLDDTFVSGLAVARYREYSSSVGSWMSPDPYGGSYDFTNPQSFNRYSYVMNDPMSGNDPLGLVKPACKYFYCVTVDDTGYYDGDPFDYISDLNIPIGAPVVDGGGGGPNNGQEAPPACQAKILNATNNQFGKNYTKSNVTNTFNYSTGAGPGQGTLNLNINGSTAGVTPGYYPIHWWTYAIGYGSTLHAVSGPGGNGGLDSQQTLPFGPNQGTFHIDSGFPYNPIGLFFHWLLNMTKAGGYPQC